MADVRHTLLEATRALERAGVPDPRLDAEWLLAHVLGMDRLSMRMSGAAQLTPQQEQRMASLLLSRTRRTPLQYLLGTQGFYGLEIQTAARALIPRQEPETLCETGIAHLRALGPAPAPEALDLCTGTGAVALALKHECPFARVSASDASGEALSLARENARRLGLSVDFFAGDLFDAVGERRFDLIVSNPPYIREEEILTLSKEVRCHEPHLALSGGADGLCFYRRIAKDAKTHLAPGGFLMVEIGQDQAEGVQSIFQSEGYHSIALYRDLENRDRVIQARLG